MTHDLETTVRQELEGWRPPAGLMSVADAIHEIDAARTFLIENLKAGVDYGLIPGCGDKPALLQPGAEKVRIYFQLSPEITRTHYAASPGGECEFAYRCVVRRVLPTGELGAPLGDRESWAVSTESTFRKRSGNALVATKNAMSARAQKRAFVAAIRQAAALSDIFTIEDAPRAPEYIDERQQGIVLALLAIAKPELVQAEITRARKTRQVHWQPYLESALDAIDFDGDDAARDATLEALLRDDATAETVAERFQRPDVASIVEGEVIDA